ncbi:hypothetical protein [Actinoplanes derwentensis]|uniref:Uncharacterized protein n=1 Tax=Actinoplanes derwentensis TaxID=113562 RepID=A0A1H1YSM3_9ACTN|nr:hypothetical protein [Actinoplanes derwentensis]GID81274.1 hypothetical protein Ade03nite_01980 [Actinoplanes derwentensis]SDT24515.1 hypothetical protein SAMN04489716_2983 [Actinoplanes derwentensis]
MRSRVLVVATIALAAMSGCAAEEKPQASGTGGAKVATLQSAAPSAAPSKASQRPRERLDTTPEEWELLMAPYYKCLREQGVIKEENGNAAKMVAVDPKTAAAYEAADKICEPQFMPLPPWEKDPANPEARDFAVGVVKCLKNKGVEYVEVSEDGISIAMGGDDNDAKSIRLGMQYMSECERQVAAKN